MVRRCRSSDLVADQQERKPSGQRRWPHEQCGERKRPIVMDPSSLGHSEFEHADVPAQLDDDARTREQGQKVDPNGQKQAIDGAGCGDHAYPASPPLCIDVSRYDRGFTSRSCSAELTERVRTAVTHPYQVSITAACGTRASRCHPYRTAMRRGPDTRRHTLTVMKTTGPCRHK